MNNKIIKLLIFVLIITLGSGCFLTSAYPDGPTVTINGVQTIVIGESFQAEVTVTPDRYPQTVVWFTSDELVLNVTEEGLVTGVGEGRATVYARYEDDDYLVDGRLSVKVVSEKIIYTNEAPNSISLYGEKNPYVGTLELYRFVTSPINASQEIVYSSSNEEVATIDASGVCKYLKEGTTTIKVTSLKNQSVYAALEVNVVSPVKDNDFETSMINCIKDTKDSILGVANYVYSGKDLSKNSIGSGFVYACWGYLDSGVKTYDLTKSNIVRYGYYLLTNKHVVEGSDALKIYMHQTEEEVEASLVQVDDKVDLAVVEFTYSEYIKPLKFYNSDLLVGGNVVIAIGNPEGFEFSSSATMGIVSYQLRYLGDDTDGDGINDWDAAYIQHDAAINPGNSGGPLLNLYGQVVGINTLKFAATEIDNMGFSIPSADVVDLIPYLENGIVPTRAKIGITVAEVYALLQVSQSTWEYNYKIPQGCVKGLYITNVSVDSVAYGKLFADDILISFNGVTLTKSTHLRAELGVIVVGSDTAINVVVLRNGVEVEVILIF